eukprot:195282-Chlamydomonas_euryale.AAC.1
MASTRGDLLSRPYLEEIARLQDRVAPFPCRQALAVMEGAFGRPPRDVFETVSESPVAAASLGQVWMCVRVCEGCRNGVLLPDPLQGTPTRHADTKPSKHATPPAHPHPPAYTYAAPPTHPQPRAHTCAALPTHPHPCAHTHVALPTHPHHCAHTHAAPPTPPRPHPHPTLTRAPPSAVPWVYRCTLRARVHSSAPNAHTLAHASNRTAGVPCDAARGAGRRRSRGEGVAAGRPRAGCARPVPDARVGGGAAVGGVDVR